MRGLRLALASFCVAAFTAALPGTARASSSVTVSAGAQQTCAVTGSGGAQCWGYGGDGELGNGSLSDSSTPVDASGLTSGVAAVSTGFTHTCALTTGGGVKCWGYNGYGQLGVPSP